MSKVITEERKNRIDQVLSRRQRDLTLIMDNIWDPHNVSAVFGVAGVHLYYTDSQWPDLAQKSSASAKKWIERTEHIDAAEMIAGLKGQGMQILRTGFSDTARPVMDFDFTRPTAVILSNEHRGTSPELAKLVPDEVYIPMQGMVQSFNVSVAAAIILYQAFTQRNAAGMYDEPSFSREELESLKTQWYSR